MASISLRAYNKEIERLIENEQVKDAIAHCRHILRLFSKHIETYRLLGRAYLESQRYTEAADVLQRVLSSLPDDFVSQIGMSMIREDEGNLDAAIFHMDRAFETQPSNSAVQEELKRLYGRRDGVVPAKIRLTRGALVRMYARGDLFQQAIAEAKVALVENPDRVELEVILARMYFQSGQKVAATEIASRLIEKLPYCIEANRILAEVLPGTARADDARVYKQRLIALDPYLAYVPANSSSSADAPDESVMLEIYDGEIEEAQAAELDWAQSVGVKLEEPEEEALPDWLLTPEAGKTEQEITPAEELAAEIETVEPVVEAEPEVEPMVEAEFETEAEVEQSSQVDEATELEEELPDWMQSAGWQPASGDITEQPPVEEFTEEFTIEEEAVSEPAAEAEIPDWLQAIAPADEAVAKGPDLPVPDSEEDTAWLESILSDAEQKAASLSNLELAAEEESDLIAAMGMGEELPPSLDDDFMAEIEPAEFTPEKDGEIPEWLSGLAEIEEAPEEPVPSTEDDDWLEVLSTKASTIEAQETISGEEDLAPIMAEEEFDTGFEPVLDETSAPEIPAEPFATFWDEEAPMEEVTPFAAETPVEAEKTTDDFLAEFEAAAPVDPDATQPTRVRQPDVEPIIEMPAVDEFEAEEELSEDVKAFSEEAEPGNVEDDGSEAEAEAQVIPAPLLMDEEDLSIFDLVEPEEVQPVQPVSQAEAVEETEAEDIYVPDWLKETLDKETVEVEAEEAADEAAESLPEVPEIAEEVVAGDAETIEEPDDDAAFAWLEALAARQGADEETLQVAPEERSVEAPDWVKAEVEQAESDLDQVSVPIDMELEPEDSGEAVQEVEIEADAAVEGEPTGIPSFETPEVEIEAPAWSDVETEPSEEAEAVPAEAESSKEAEDLPDWLKETLAVEEETSEAELESEPQPVIYRAAGEWQPEELTELEAEAPAEISSEIEAEAEPVVGMAEEVEVEPAVEFVEASEFEPEPAVETAEAVEPEPEATFEMAEEAEPVSVETAESVSEGTQLEDTEPEEVPDWLRGLAEEQAGEAPLPVVDAETPPEWLKDLESEESGLMPEVPYSASTGQTGWLKKAEESVPTSKVEDTSPVRVVPTPSGAQPASAGGDDLYNAQAALNGQNIDAALEYYNRLINRGEALEETIHDLRDAIYRYPVDVNIWQSLGDAYMRSNQLQEALDAYTKAEELLR
ncbi:MAG TPA: tetratricopeptide repeat protein [Bellilinea sp.]|nr:tetratricopeptide repeat protein [Bellilinea sp.]